jgi:hypothetical protein
MNPATKLLLANLSASRGHSSHQFADPPSRVAHVCCNCVEDNGREFRRLGAKILRKQNIRRHRGNDCKRARNHSCRTDDQIVENSPSFPPSDPVPGRHKRMIPRCEFCSVHRSVRIPDFCCRMFISCCLTGAELRTDGRFERGNNPGRVVENLCVGKSGFAALESHPDH